MITDVRRDIIYKQLHDDYGEWIELGYPTDEFLISLLIKERDRIGALEQRIIYLEKAINGLHY